MNEFKKEKKTTKLVAKVLKKSYSPKMPKWRIYFVYVGQIAM